MSSRHKLLGWVLAGVIAACAFVLFCAVWRIGEANRLDETSRQLTRFSLDLQTWMMATEQIPGSSLAAAIHQLTGNPQTSETITSSRYPLVFGGRDGWGRTLVYEVNQEEQCLVVRSLGPDGVDDHGTGDDISGYAMIPRGASQEIGPDNGTGSFIDERGE